MSKKTIQIIIILMSIALMGIVGIQYTWLKRSIDLNAKNFDDKITMTLDRVKVKLEQDAKDLGKYSSEVQAILRRKDPAASSRIGIESYRLDRQGDQQMIMRNILLLRPQEALNNIDLNSLDNHIKAELAARQISLKYEYGIYSQEEEDYIITNGKFNVMVKNQDEASESGIKRNLDKTMYEQSLYSEQGIAPVAFLRLFFPKRGSYLLTSILPALLSSIIFTGLILFCFVYTINIILTQKKISIMKTDFINNMTHEFKTPIATISLAADSIENPLVKNKPELISRYAKIIKEENERMLTQVEKVLQIAKVDKKEIELSISDVDIHEIITTAAEMAEFKAKSRNGSVTLDLVATQTIVQGDEGHLSNIMHNLLDNAEKYSLENPTIHISTRDVKNGIEISVTDQGIGMHKDELRKIFEKFYRVSTGNVHDVKGFGLGLSYVKAMVDAHRGKITVESEEGKGSIFRVFIPLFRGGDKFVYS